MERVNARCRAGTWGEGRFTLAGDAAHAMPPTTGAAAPTRPLRPPLGGAARISHGGSRAVPCGAAVQH